MTPAVRPSPAGALARGLRDVAQAPLLIVAVTVMTMAMALPFAIALGTRLQTSLSLQPQVVLAETDIDPEWWEEFRRQARGLDATFTPAILGFAATLDSISGLLDGRQPPAGVLGPLALSIVVWAFLWGGILRRFERGGRIGIGGFIQSGLAFAPRFIAIALTAAVLVVGLYFSLHAVLFGPVYRTVAAMTSNARDAFFVRLVLYLVFLAPLMVVSLIADYARVASVAGGASSFTAACRAGLSFVRGHLAPVAALSVMASIILLAVTVAYGVLEVYGGSRVGGWRAIAIAQAYIVFRLAMRLAVAAAELRLFAPAATPQSPSTASAAREQGR
jgi:hypothetical protein